jgi:MoxR-like ATPase
MLYVNSSVPVKSSAEAAALLANVRANFQDGEHVSSLHRLVDAAVRKILGDLHGDDVKDVQALDTSDWRDTLMHQIQTKIKLGDARTYVPVVSGQPGIGKTAQAVDVAQKLNMRLIHIDCSTLSVDEITGIPIPQGQGDKMSVTFSEPPLYKKIMDDIKEADQHYLASATAQQKREYARQPYKYLIFFDEMNRVKSSNVFNSLRRVVLEKSFNDTTHLPKDSIIIAAINPYDKGTVELTGHLKDSIDVINTAPSWSGLQSYLTQRLQADDLARRHEQSKTVALDIVNAFADTFAQKKTTAAVGADSRKFHIRVGDDSVYISPREYSTMCLDLVAGVDRVVGQAVGMDADEYQTAIYEAAWSKLESTLEWIFDKHQVDSPQFMATVKNWLRQYSAKFLIKTRTSAQLEDMLDTVVSDTSQHLKDDVDFVNYVNNFDLNRFAEDFENYLGKLVKREKRAIDVLLANTHNKKVVENGKLSITKDMTSKLEYVINELRMAARAHNLSADLEDRMEQSVIATVGELSGDLSEQELTATLDKIHEIFTQK